MLVPPWRRSRSCPGTCWAGRAGTPPSEKLNIAGVGIGGQGGSDLHDVSSENIVALCDVDWDYAAHTFKQYPKAKQYKDFREMLDKEKGIDAVVVGTPDHTHAVVTMTAIKLGKHVYCEKPLTRTVYEARALAKAARAAKVATQMGNQGMAFEGNRLINEWLWDGAIGPVREVHVWSDRPTHSGKLPLYWAQGIERPKDTPPVPATLDWDLWLGPAPWRPYHPAYAPFRWRGWWDFGSGGLGDMGIHNLAPVCSALKLGAPVSVERQLDAVQQGDAAAGLDGPLRVPRPRRHAAGHAALVRRRDRAAAPAGAGGRTASCPARTASSSSATRARCWSKAGAATVPRLIPEAKMQAYKRPPKTLPRSIGHHKEWIKACKEGTPTRSSFATSPAR